MADDAQPGLDPRDRDAMIRTVLTEAASNDPMGWAAVASTIRNRLATGKFGDTPSAVVRAPGQFEVWQNGRAQAVTPNHPNYEAAGRIVDAVAQGLPDPTGGSTHFYSPSGQAALGRNPPAWGRQPLTAIGGNTFFAPQGAVTFQGSKAIDDATSGKQPVASADDIFKRWGVDTGDSKPANAPAPAKDASTDVFKRWGVDTSNPVNPPLCLPSRAGPRRHLLRSPREMPPLLQGKQSSTFPWSARMSKAGRLEGSPRSARCRTTLHFRKNWPTSKTSCSGRKRLTLMLRLGGELWGPVPR
jgi:hypothetical protein